MIILNDKHTFEMTIAPVKVSCFFGCPQKVELVAAIRGEEQGAFA